MIPFTRDEDESAHSEEALSNTHSIEEGKNEEENEERERKLEWLKKLEKRPL